MKATTHEVSAAAGIDPSVDADELRDLAREIRRRVLRMTHLGRASHVGSSLSITDVIAVLYGATLNIDPADPADPGRDRLIMSKGHASAALYAALALRGFFDEALLDTFYQDGTSLCGHVTAGAVPGVEHSTGSLGHGLSVGAGMALAAVLDRAQYRTFVILSDGECDEGAVWESAMFAGHHHLDNLVAVVDYNDMQSLTTVSETLGLEPFEDKWRAFGWGVEVVDGHDVASLAKVLGAVPFERGRPSVVLANTVKGRGVSFMEGVVGWHYWPPDEAQLQAALREIDDGVS